MCVVCRTFLEEHVYVRMWMVVYRRRCLSMRHVVSMGNATRRQPCQIPKIYPVPCILGVPP